MTYNDIEKFLEAGKRPLICFTRKIINQNNQFEEGMLAEIVDIELDDFDETTCKIIVNEEKYQESNKNLEKPIWYDSKKQKYCKKFSEDFKREDIAFFLDSIDEMENFIIKDGNIDLFYEFLETGESSYIEWLEEQVNISRALII